MSTPHPPKWADRFLEWFCREDLYDAIRGDLEEFYTRNHHNHGPRKAAWLFVWHVVLFFQPFAFKKKTRFTPSSPIPMFKHYLKVSWRNLVRQKMYAIIKIGGFSIGIALFVLIS
ncbi:MAG: permease prefix domain 2-containing transporter, partial [Bacteroidota bacterium]